MVEGAFRHDISVPDDSSAERGAFTAFNQNYTRSFIPINKINNEAAPIDSYNDSEMSDYNGSEDLDENSEGEDEEKSDDEGDEDDSIVEKMKKLATFSELPFGVLLFILQRELDKLCRKDMYGVVSDIKNIGHRALNEAGIRNALQVYLKEAEVPQEIYNKLLRTSARKGPETHRQRTARNNIVVVRNFFGTTDALLYSPSQTNMTQEYTTAMKNWTKNKSAKLTDMFSAANRAMGTRLLDMIRNGSQPKQLFWTTADLKKSLTNFAVNPKGATQPLTKQEVDTLVSECGFRIEACGGVQLYLCEKAHTAFKVNLDDYLEWCAPEEDNVDVESVSLTPPEQSPEEFACPCPRSLHNVRDYCIKSQDHDLRSLIRPIVSYSAHTVCETHLRSLLKAKSLGWTQEGNLESMSRTDLVRALNVVVGLDSDHDSSEPGRFQVNIDGEAVWRRILPGSSVPFRDVQKAQLLQVGNLYSWFFEDATLGGMFDTELALYANNSRHLDSSAAYLALVYSVLQQVMYQDPCLYALNVIMSGNGRTSLISVPAPVTRVTTQPVYRIEAPGQCKMSVGGNSGTKSTYASMKGRSEDLVEEFLYGLRHSKAATQEPPMPLKTSRTPKISLTIALEQLLEKTTLSDNNPGNVQFEVQASFDPISDSLDPSEAAEIAATAFYHLKLASRISAKLLPTDQNGDPFPLGLVKLDGLGIISDCLVGRADWGSKEAVRAAQVLLGGREYDEEANELVRSFRDAVRAKLLSLIPVWTAQVVKYNAGSNPLYPFDP